MQIILEKKKIAYGKQMSITIQFLLFLVEITKIQSSLENKKIAYGKQMCIAIQFLLFLVEITKIQSSLCILATIF